MKERFKKFKKNPKTIPIWQVIVQKYHPTFIGECENAIQMSTQMVSDWLKSGMFKDDSDADAKSKKIVQTLNNHEDTKTHARHIHMEEALEIGLLIKSLENDFDQEFQDIVLTVHHSFMHTLGNSPTIKIIENQIGNAIIYTLQENR